jgi:hypothetical protein
MTMVETPPLHCLPELMIMITSTRSRVPPVHSQRYTTATVNRECGGAAVLTTLVSSVRVIRACAGGALRCCVRHRDRLANDRNFTPWTMLTPRRGSSAQDQALHPTG